MVKHALLLTALVTACKWTEFDDLASTTWAHSQQKPSGESAADYAIQIANASADPTGGKLAVLSNDKPTYSTLDFDASGGTTRGPNALSLAGHFITTLGENSFLIDDPVSHKIAIVAAAIDTGSVAVVSGPADMTADTTFPAQPPQAATFSNGNVVVIAGDQMTPTATDVFVLGGAAPTKCSVVDDTGMALSAVAMASDDTTLWVWTKTGALLGYSYAAITAPGCGTAMPKHPDVGPVATGFAPAVGARIHILGSPSGATELAVLAGHGDRMTTGNVYVVDLKAPPPTVTSALPADDLRASAVGQLGDATYVILGFPDRATGSVTGGQVELHTIDPATGVIATTPTALFNDAQPEANQRFGRAVAVMTFNGKNILVVAASNEIFAYYHTHQYDYTPK